MNNNYENLPAVLNANQLATALGISRAGAYQLLNTESFPTLRIGVPSTFMRKFICRLRLNEVSRQ